MRAMATTGKEAPPFFEVLGVADFSKTFGTFGPHVAMADTGGLTGPRGLTASEKQICKRLGISAETFLLGADDVPLALMEVSAEQPVSGLPRALTGEEKRICEVLGISAEVFFLGADDAPLALMEVSAGQALTRPPRALAEPEERICKLLGISSETFLLGA